MALGVLLVVAPGCGELPAARRSAPKPLAAMRVRGWFSPKAGDRRSRSRTLLAELWASTNCASHQWASASCIPRSSTWASSRPRSTPDRRSRPCRPAPGSLRCRRGDRVLDLVDHHLAGLPERRVEEPRRDEVGGRARRAEPTCRRTLGHAGVRGGRAAHGRRRGPSALVVRQLFPQRGMDQAVHRERVLAGIDAGEGQASYLPDRASAKDRVGHRRPQSRQQRRCLACSLQHPDRDGVRTEEGARLQELEGRRRAPPEAIERDRPCGGDGHRVARGSALGQQLFPLFLEETEVLVDRHSRLDLPGRGLFDGERQVADGAGDLVGVLVLSRGARRWRCSMDSSRRKTSTGSASPYCDQAWFREVTRMWPGALGREGRHSSGSSALSKTSSQRGRHAPPQQVDGLLGGGRRRRRPGRPAGRQLGESGDHVAGCSEEIHHTRS